MPKVFEQFLLVKKFRKVRTKQLATKETLRNKNVKFLNKKFQKKHQKGEVFKFRLCYAIFVHLLNVLVVLNMHKGRSFSIHLHSELSKRSLLSEKIPTILEKKEDSSKIFNLNSLYKIVLKSFCFVVELLTHENI